MLFGSDVDEADAHAQLDTVYEAGVNCFDTAEMYAVPPRAATAGASERVLGSWLARHPLARQRSCVATKVSGPGSMAWLRGGPSALDPGNITLAIEGSLQRLGVDCIDLLQLHWPDRNVPMFGKVRFDPARDYASCPIEDQLAALGRAVAAGKVRHVGLSNETPWGLMHFLGAAGGPLPRVVSLQSAYSLTCRSFEHGLAECCHREGVGFMAYSPLAAGLLTGKYEDGSGGPPQARLNRHRARYSEDGRRFARRAPVVAAVGRYADLAREWGLTPARLALAWVLHNSLVTTAVIGATSLPQLRELLAAAEGPELDPDLLAACERVHAMSPNPTP